MDLARLLAPLDPIDYDQVVDASNAAAQAPASPTLRVGAWSFAEEAYAMALIEAFLMGLLPGVAAGTPLRSFLAQKLECVPMRVSKKLALDQLAGRPLLKKLGQKRYLPSDTTDSAVLSATRQQLQHLENAFLCAKEKDILYIRGLDTTTIDPAAKVPLGRPPTAAFSSVNALGHRTGYWLREEQMYAHKLIDCFLKGYLDLPKGVTLRSFLADRLTCSPMRISKKLATGSLMGRMIPKKIGTAVYVPKFDSSADFVRLVAQAQVDLNRLRRACLDTWSWAEVQYTMALIDAFQRGCFPTLPVDTTLRGFLATRLQCVPMRVSKKLASGSLAGKSVAKKLGKLRYVRDPLLSRTTLEAVHHRLDGLEADFLQAVKLEAANSSGRRPTTPTSPGRAGHWPLEEEVHALKLINSFLNGSLDVPPGTTLRAFLAERLDCSPMRVSKKLGTGMLLGRSLPRRLGSTVYVPNHRSTLEEKNHVVCAQLESRRCMCFEC
ncbi:hypothetical protein ACHHYP_13560 [Achlya hypogyna]|uniref:Uncharacterized protein n=1 Tax=Achlya hypogyna TaxID=1202772 RepID=A0A1V9YEU5_ACHHY|nr:hypothetical protein ACHHYP_13560 [Achlya hypogyna]